LLLQKFLKRAFDLCFTFVATLVLLPITSLVSLLILTTSPGAILFRSKRVGKTGKQFTLYKFRTMVADASTLGPSVTHKHDSRITGFGRFLRNTKFDEFPQVINVLTGEMSIIGPRPECPEYVAHYLPHQREVLCMRPGLTSLAQVMYREEESLLPEKDTEVHYLNYVLPRKLALDLYYTQNWSLLLDLKIFLLGLLALLKVDPPNFLWPMSERHHLPDRSSN